MLITKFLAPLVGLTVADVVSAAKIRFAPRRVNHSKNPQIKEVNMSILKKLVASIARLNPAGSWSAVQKLVLEKAGMQSLLLTLTLVVTAFWVSQAAMAAEKKMVTDPTTGEMVTAPEYGGTLTYVRKQVGEHTDVYFIGGWASHFISGVLEKLSIADWGIDRDVVDWKTTYIPLSGLKGALAESWSQPDPLTYVFKIRQGVHWHDKAPMNGRAFTAKDVEYNFHRAMGLGSGYTEHSTMFGPLHTYQWDSVTATDDSTVVMKLKEPQPLALYFIVDHFNVFMYPPEVFEQYGDVKDWRNLVGTGPFMLTDFVEDSSITWDKNPNYWGFDEKYPENRLPYIDQLRGAVMPEPAVFVAALRSAKVDYAGTPGDSQLRSIDQVESLKKTNPELVIHPYWYRSDNAFTFNVVDKPPFDDIRVRKAMQMALDLETINRTFFKGYGNWEPAGLPAADIKGYTTPFAEWPEEVRKGYTYDPEGAGKLLDEAGFPLDSDGIRFKTVLNSTYRYDLNYLELAAAYWREIGIVAEINLMDSQAAIPMRNDGTYEGFWAWSTGGRWIPVEIMRGYYSKDPRNWRGIAEPEYDALFETALATADVEEQQRMVRELDMYGIERHWVIWGPETPQFNVHQPWVKGYNGEISLGVGQFNTPFTRLWIDQDLKKEMGH